MENWENLVLKGLLMLVTAPAWYPFLKAVWEELNESMAEEGGLFGRMPTSRELEEIERDKRGRPEPLVHEPWPSPEQRMSSRKTLGARESKSAQPSKPTPGRSPRRRGF